jgi:hypothetical protein
MKHLATLALCVVGNNNLDAFVSTQSSTPIARVVSFLEPTVFGKLKSV